MFIGADQVRRAGEPGPLEPARTRLLREFRHTSPFLGCRFDPTGRYVLAGAQDNGIHRFDLGSGAKVSLTGHRSWVRALAFAGGKLYAGDYAGKILVWDYLAATPRVERTIDAHRGWVRALAVSPDGATLASCGNDRVVRTWSIERGEMVREYAGGHEVHVYNVAYHPDGRNLASADLRGVVKHWNVAEGTITRTLDCSILFRYDPTFRADHGGVRSMTFTADGRHLACAGITDVTNAFAGVGKPAVVLFDWGTGNRFKVLRPTANFQGTAWGVVHHAEGNFFAAAGGGSGGALWFWRPDQERSFHHLALPNNARDLSLHPTGRYLAIPFYDSMVRVYDLRPAVV